MSKSIICLLLSITFILSPVTLAKKDTRLSKSDPKLTANAKFWAQSYRGGSFIGSVFTYGFLISSAGLPGVTQRDSKMAQSLGPLAIGISTLNFKNLVEMKCQKAGHRLLSPLNADDTLVTRLRMFAAITGILHLRSFRRNQHSAAGVFATITIAAVVAAEGLNAMLYFNS